VLYKEDHQTHTPKTGNWAWIHRAPGEKSVIEWIWKKYIFISNSVEKPKQKTVEFMTHGFYFFYQVSNDCFHSNFNKDQ